MTAMMLNGLLCCLLFMLTSAAIKHEPKPMAEHQMYEEGSRANIQGRNRRCGYLGGECIKNREDCPKDKPLHTAPGHPYCANNKRCCYPGITPEECSSVDGCFFLYASDQCFCVANATEVADATEETGVNWYEARKGCKDRGHEHPQQYQLPHPSDAIALRSAIVQAYGNCDHLWLNAKTAPSETTTTTTTTSPIAIGVTMRWQDNWVQITRDNPLLRTHGPFLPNQCLEMIATENAMKHYPNQPYEHEHNCHEKGPSHAHFLCERNY